MAGEWVVASLGDLVEIKHGYAFRGEFFRDEPIGDILLTPGNFAIGGGFRDDKFKYYDGPVPNDFVLKEGDLIVTMTDLSKNADTLGFAACVPTRVEGRHFLHNQRLGKVTITNEQAADLGFIEYLMRSTEYRHEIVASATGTTVKHTSPERIKRFRFLLPPLPEQRAIACILGALDDKIDLNRRMNRTLEAMARALFQSWFVDFDPVRAKLALSGAEGAAGQAPAGLKPEIAALFPDRLVAVEGREAPEGWRVGSFLDLADLLSGGTPRTSVVEYWDGDIPWVSAKDVSGAKGSYLLETEKTISALGVEKSSTRILPAHTTIITARGTVGSYCILGAEMAMNQTNYGLRAKNGVGDFFVFFATAEMVEHLKQQAYGTIFDTITTKTFRDTKTVQPPKSILKEYDSQTAPIMAKVFGNEQQSRTLAALRDTLLPKLISGAVRVADAERIVERCVS